MLRAIELLRCVFAVRVAVRTLLVQSLLGAMFGGGEADAFVQISTSCHPPRGLPSRAPSLASRPLTPAAQKEAHVSGAEGCWSASYDDALRTSSRPTTALSATAPAAEAAAPLPRRKARVTVRRAKEPDYERVAGIRAVIIPVGMSGATGFLGGKVVVDDPAEAKRRLLMAKVADLVSGEAVALIALEGGRIVGTVDCIVQPVSSNEMERQGGQARVKVQPIEKQQDNNNNKQTPLSLPRPRVFLKNLFVLPEQRRRGIARELVKGAEAFAKREKAGTVCLQVARNNAPARELYVSCGFEETEPPGPTEGGMGGALLKSLGMGKRYMAKAV